MPLTLREWEQIKVAIEVMGGYRVNDHGMVYAENVLAVLQRWREDPPAAEAAKEKS